MSPRRLVAREVATSATFVCPPATLLFLFPFLRIVLVGSQTGGKSISKSPSSPAEKKPHDVESRSVVRLMLSEKFLGSFAATTVTWGVAMYLVAHVGVTDFWVALETNGEFVVVAGRFGTIMFVKAMDHNRIVLSWSIFIGRTMRRKMGDRQMFF